MNDDDQEKVDDQPALEDQPPGESADDVEEALAWLEKLAAKQGVSVEELALRYPDAIELSFPELGLAEADELPEWLKETPPARRLREIFSSAGEAVALDDLPDWLLPDSPDASRSQESKTPDLSAELENRLDWLAEIDKEDEMAEMPTVRWRSEESYLPGQAISSSAGTVKAEMGTEPETPEGAQSESLSQTPADAPEDLDEAMAWLEELATSQDTPLEELPSVADRILASQIMAESGLELEEAPSVDPVFTPSFVDEAFDGVDTEPIELADFPDNLDDAMDYLDQLAAGRQQSQESAGVTPPVGTESLASTDVVISTGDEAPVTTPAAEELVATAGEEEADEEQIEEFVLVASSALEEVAYEEMAPDEVTSESEFIRDELSESEVESQELADEEQAGKPVLDIASDLEEVVDEEMAPEEVTPEFARDELAESEVEPQELADEEQTGEPVLDLASDLEEVTYEEVAPEEVILEFIPDELAESEVEPQEFLDEEQEMELSEETTEAIDEVDTADAVVVLEAETSPALQVSSFELDLALTRLDRLSLPPDVTLESLDETLAETPVDDYSSELNGHYDNLDDALLWLEQQLDAAEMSAPSDEMGASPIVATQEPENAPDELMLEVASLDDEVVAELTADMPDDPDEALTWLMNLTEEVQESETEPEIMVIPYPEGRGARVYDLVDVVDPVDEPEPPAAGQFTSEIAVESQASSVELAQPEVEPLAAGDLPEMPDDPDEAIAWIERLAAMEEQESRLGLGDVEGEAEPQRGEGDSVIADSSAIAIPQSAINQEDEKAEAYETYDEADIADEERMSDERIDENEASESLDPMPVEQPAMQPAARQPHERWLDLLQPPPWLDKG